MIFVRTNEINEVLQDNGRGQMACCTCVCQRAIRTVNESNVRRHDRKGAGGTEEDGRTPSVSDVSFGRAL